MIILAPFTYVYSIFVKDFKIFLGTEIGILVLDASSYNVQYQYITNSRVEFITFLGSWIYYFSNNNVYKISLNWQLDRKPISVISNISKPRKFGISDDYKIILDYGSYKKIYNDVGFEVKEYYGNIYYSSFDTLNFPNNSIWDFRKRDIKLNFSYEYGDYNFVGTEGGGLRIYYRNSLSLRDSIVFGTFNRTYKSITIKDNKIYILGDKGIDILNEDFKEEDFIRLDVCTYEAEILNDFVFCKNNFYRIENNDIRPIMKAINFGKVRYLKDNYYLLAFDGVYKFDSNSLLKIFNEEVYDVYLYGDSVQFLTKTIVSDRYVRVVNVNDKVYLCSRYGIKEVSDSSKAYSFSIGNVNDCIYHNDFIFIASDNGLFRFSFKDKNFYQYPYLNNIKKLLIFENKLLAFTNSIIYVLSLS